MSKTDEVETQGQELAVMPPAVVERFTELMSSIPEADSSEALERIVAQIMDSETVEDLDAAWSGMGMTKVLGRALVFQEIKLLPSDYTGGLKWYLGCDCVMQATGEKTFVTTGSIAIMAQLATAHRKGLLPFTAVPRQAERPSRAGFYPQHLETNRGAQ